MMSKSLTVSVFPSHDIYTFRTDTPVQLPRYGWVRRILAWVFRPLRRQYIVTAVNKSEGTITMSTDPAWWRFL